LYQIFLIVYLVTGISACVLMKARRRLLYTLYFILPIAGFVFLALAPLATPEFSYAPAADVLRLTIGMSFLVSVFPLQLAAGIFAFLVFGPNNIDKPSRTTLVALWVALFAIGSAFVFLSESQ
jgi:hypothetical protein